MEHPGYEGADWRGAVSASPVTPILLGESCQRRRTMRSNDPDGAPPPQPPPPPPPDTETRVRGEAAWEVIRGDSGDLPVPPPPPPPTRPPEPPRERITNLRGEKAYRVTHGGRPGTPPSPSPSPPPPPPPPPRPETETKVRGEASFMLCGGQLDGAGPDTPPEPPPPPPTGDTTEKRGEAAWPHASQGFTGGRDLDQEPVTLLAVLQRRQQQRVPAS